MFYSILYRSHATLPERGEREMEMVDAAVSRNGREDVTGLLHRESDTYFQWLEGSRRQVEAIYQSIVRDERHNNVVCLKRGVIGERSFSQWSMAYSSSTEESLFEWAAKLDLSLLLPDPAEILNFLVYRSVRL